MRSCDETSRGKSTHQIGSVCSLWMARMGNNAPADDVGRDRSLSCTLLYAASVDIEFAARDDERGH